MQDVTIHVPIQRIAGQEEPQSVMKSTVLQLEALIQGHDLAETLSSSVDVTVSSYQSVRSLHPFAAAALTITLLMTSGFLISRKISALLIRSVKPERQCAE